MLNDATHLSRILAELRRCGVDDVIVVDGHSNDSPASLIEDETILQCEPSRGLQLATGIQHSRRDLIWILHADSSISPAVVQQLSTVSKGLVWGRFDVEFVGSSGIFEVISCTMNLRSAITGVCTGDQGIFLSRQLLEQVPYFPRDPLMEDISLSKLLKRVVKPIRMRTKILISPRKWETEGVFRTILRMAYYRLLFFLGVSAETLYRRYYRRSPKSA